MSADEVSLCNAMLLMFTFAALHMGPSPTRRAKPEGPTEFKKSGRAGAAFSTWSSWAKKHPHPGAEASQVKGETILERWAEAKRERGGGSDQDLPVSILAALWPVST